MAVQFAPPSMLTNTPPPPSSGVEGVRGQRINDKGKDIGIGEAIFQWDVQFAPEEFEDIT